MIYITLDHLYTYAFDRSVKESTQDFDKTLENLERDTIALIKPYLCKYYDIKKIFDPETPVRHGMLIKIITKIILHEAISRNAYRKVSQNSKDDYDWAMATLEKLNTGRLVLTDLPEKPKQQNSTMGLIHGNLSNKNFYI